MKKIKNNQLNNKSSKIYNSKLEDQAKLIIQLNIVIIIYNI